MKTLRLLKMKIQILLSNFQHKMVLGCIPHFLASCNNARRKLLNLATSVNLNIKHIQYPRKCLPSTIFSALFPIKNHEEIFLSIFIVWIEIWY